MEKNMEFASSSTQHSAPLPSAPPSYEEAVENVPHLPRLPSNPPYPVGPPLMPVPGHRQLPIQTTVPYPPVYAEACQPLPQAQPPPRAQPPPQAQTQYNANPNVAPVPEVRDGYQPVICTLSSNPIKATCPICHASIKTTTISDYQLSAHLCCLLLCLIGCCLCSCLPYGMSNFMNVHHFCPKCKHYFGTWRG